MIAWILRGILALQITAVALLSWYIWTHHGRSLGLPASIFLALIIVILIHPLAIAFYFLISRIYGSDVPPEHRLTITRALETYDAEVDASIRGFSIAHPFLEKCAFAKVERPIHPLPILFVHGYFCNRASWRSWAAVAARRGFRCAAITLEPAFESIESYAPKLNQAIEDLCAASGATRVLVICHSMGGLAMRVYMNAFSDERVAHLFTLGSPHHGTILANRGHGKNVHQMRIDSLWLEKLNGGETPERRAKISSYFSFHDNIVVPQLSSYLEGANNHAMHGIGHVSMLYSAALQDRVLDDILEHFPVFERVEAPSREREMSAPI